MRTVNASEHSVTYTVVASLCCTPESNVISWVTYTSTEKKRRKKCGFLKVKIFVLRLLCNLVYLTAKSETRRAENLRFLKQVELPE